MVDSTKWRLTRGAGRWIGGGAVILAIALVLLLGAGQDESHVARGTLGDEDSAAETAAGDPATVADPAAGADPANKEVSGAPGTASESSGGRVVIRAVDATSADPDGTGHDQADAVTPPAPLCGPDEGGRVSTEPAVPPMSPPAAVRGIYLNAWAFGSARRRAQLMDLADRTEINTFVLDAKDNTGFVSYPSSVAVARSVGAHCDVRVRNIRAVLAEMRERGIYPIARIVVFQDPLLATFRPELSIRHRDGPDWRDHHGQPWVDPYDRYVWDYHIELAREAVALGFAEIQWDYVRFPDVPRAYMATALYPAAEGRSRQEAIREFLRYSREQLSDLGVPVTADVFGLTVSASGDMGIGQDWGSMVDVTDVLLPMVYPSHFARGSYGIAYPNAEPYDVVFHAMQHAQRRTQGVQGAARIRPWLQDFTLGEPRYGPEEVRSQIRAVHDAGIEEWILWNASSRYTAEALHPLYRPPPETDLPLPDSIEELLLGRPAGGRPD